MFVKRSVALVMMAVGGIILSVAARGFAQCDLACRYRTMFDYGPGQFGCWKFVSSDCYYCYNFNCQPSFVDANANDNCVPTAQAQLFFIGTKAAICAGYGGECTCTLAQPNADGPYPDDVVYECVPPGGG